MKEQVPFSMAIEKEELMHECSPEHFAIKELTKLISDNYKELFIDNAYCLYSILLLLFRMCAVMGINVHPSRINRDLVIT